MADWGGIGFVACMVLFVGCLIGGGLATVFSIACHRRRPAGAKLAMQVAAVFHFGAVAFLIAAGVLFSVLSR